jgi:hypothetical protein
MPAPGAGYTVVWGALALASGTAKTIAGIAAGANKPITITEVSISCDATSGNLLAELVYGTNATNPPGTNSTTFAPLGNRNNQIENVEGTGGINWTTEPTVLTVVRKLGRIALPNGPLIVQFPLGREPTGVIAAGTAGKFIGVRLTATVAVTNCDGHIEFEE